MSGEVISGRFAVSMDVMAGIPLHHRRLRDHKSPRRMIFQIPKTPMPLAHFHKLPRRLGWRYDYDEGQAFIYPEDITVDVFLPVGTPIPLPPVFLQPLGRGQLAHILDHGDAGLAGELNFLDRLQRLRQGLMHRQPLKRLVELKADG